MKKNIQYYKLFFLYCFIQIAMLCSGCFMQTFSFMGIKDEIDSQLPIITTFRALPDVTSIGFEWKIPQDTSLINGYIIYRKNKEGKFVKTAFIQNVFSTHYYDGKLKPQTQYEYAIATVGKDSKVSAKSETLKVKTSFIDPVDFVYASQNYAKQIKIFWSPSPNPVVKNYLIQRKDDKSGDFITIGSTQNRMLVEYFDNNLDNAVEYTYRIISQSYDGAQSMPSQLVVGKTRSAPESISGITATNNKPKAIWIEWKASENKDAIGYNIYAANSVNGEYVKLNFVRGTSYIDKIDEDGALRYYKVSVLDSYKLESDLQEEGVSGQTLPPPPTPNIRQGVVQNRSALIAWDKIADTRVQYYVVYRQGGGYGESNRFSDITNTQFVDNSMKEGIAYTYYVVSVDKLGIESIPSQKITLTLQMAKETQIQQDFKSTIDKVKILNNNTR